MNDREENNLSMKIAVEKVLTDHEPVWNSIPQFVNAVALLHSKNESVVLERQKQEKQISGITMNKFASKEAMCKTAAEVSSIVMAYASSINDNELKKTVSYSYTRMLQDRDTLARDRCLLIYNTAMPLAATLADFGLVAGKLPELNTSITNYSTLISAPRTATGDRKTAGLNIEKLLKDSDLILKNSIDKMMVPFKTTNTDFYNKYISARIIIDYGKRTHKPVSMVNGRTIDFETEEVLVNVKVYVDGDEKNGVISNDKGEFSIGFYREGEQALIAEKEGYVKCEEVLEIVKGENQEVNLEMEKVEGPVMPEVGS
jgi:hypothetical protein